MSEPVTIAVVDDDRDVREALEGLIASLGYSAILCASAEEFLAFAWRKKIDCIILDVRMPGLSGIELQQILRSDHACPPVIFMTSCVDHATRLEALAGGASCVLGKPVDSQVLIEHLEAALRRC